MTEQEKVLFLSEKIKEINKITSEIEDVFPEKSFKMDGILVGKNEEERINPIIPIEKYVRGKRTVKKSNVKKNGKTLVIGYINKNNQENKGCLNKPGNHYNQVAYLMRCNECGFEYEANGCDVAIRKCPRCM